MSKKLIAISTLLLSSAILANQPAAVDKHSCNKLIGSQKPFILILNPNDDLLASIATCVKDANLPGASISGLGQLHNPTLAYFSSNPKEKPTFTRFDGYYELASLNGNVAKNGSVYPAAGRGVAGHTAI